MNFTRRGRVRGVIVRRPVALQSDVVAGQYFAYWEPGQLLD
jgi:hypothetical protein